MECVISPKIGGVAKAMQSLPSARSRVDTTRRGDPARLFVVTALGPRLPDRRQDRGLPLTALKP